MSNFRSTTAIAGMALIGLITTTYATEPDALPGSFIVAQSTTPSSPTTARPVASVETLIGQNLKNANDESIGDINAVHVDRTGQVVNVIVGVGGFLGVGEREVAIGWKNISVTDNGARVTTSLTKDQLKALPEYKYKNPAWRGTAFQDGM